MENVKSNIREKQILMPILISIIALFIIIIQSSIYIQRLEVNLDEGAYLLKGYYFVKGIYKPYQQYGFWMDQMPLAYLIPGWIQQLFGKGLSVGRYFMSFLLVLTVIGLWVVVIRYSGKWYGALVLSAIALNPILIKMYIATVTQGISAFLLTWTFVFGFKKSISVWQLILATLFATSLVLVRINLLLVPILLVVYFFIRYGWRFGLISLLIFLSIFIYIHLIYWPGILQIYARWIPSNNFPLLRLWRVNQDLLYWHPNYDIQSRVISLFRAFRYHYILLLGSLASFLGVVKFTNNKLNKERLIDFLFVSGLFWLLIFIHAFVTLGGDHCNFCLESYIAFFAPLGYLLIVISIPLWEKAIPISLTIIIIILLLIINSGIGLLNTDNFNKGILYLHAPALSSDFPFINFTGMLLYKFIKKDHPFLTIHQIQLIDITLTSVVINLVLFIIIFIFTRIYFNKITNKNIYVSYKNNYSYGYILIIVILAFSFVLSPTRILSGGRYGYDCNSFTLKSYVNVGKELINIIPTGSKVYWNSTNPLPLLYVDNINIFPPQINDIYTFYSGGNDDYLLKLGYWNESIKNQWIHEADVIIFEERYYERYQNESFLSNKNYRLVVTTPQTPCKLDTRLYVFIKQKNR